MVGVKLNLLPPEEAVNTSLSRVLNITRMLGVIALAVFLLTAIGMGAFFVIENLQLTSLNSANDSLKSQILAQSKTESQIVLLKDRVKKIKSAQAQPSAINNLASFNPFLSTIGSDSSITELTIDPTKLSVTINFKSNASLSGFLQSVNAASVFKTVTIKTFGYNPANGYLVGIDFIPK